MWDPMTFFYFPLKTVLENNEINAKPIIIIIIIIIIFIQVKGIKSNSNALRQA